MEHGEDNGEKKLLEAGFGASEVKKQWKNPLQVQILENAYAGGLLFFSATFSFKFGFLFPF